MPWCLWDFHPINGGCCVRDGLIWYFACTEVLLSCQ